MISCFLQGGLGNQLFQIATTVSFALDNDIEPVFNLSTHHLPLQGNSAIKYKDNLYHNLKLIDVYEYNKFNIYTEPKFSYNKIPVHLKQDNYILKGFFQSEKYFVHNRNKIIGLFNPKEILKKQLIKYTSLFDGNTCSVHIRRGDYIKFPNEHPVLKIDYYEKAMEEIGMGTKFLIFSDDIVWCKNNLKGDNLIFIDDDDYVSLYLMSLCDNNIIANSSFSWWGAWLNDNQNKKVVAPTKWFGNNKKLDTKDIIPDTWIKI
jgi:hypothetical protein